MYNEHGGKRNGAGRPKGSMNKRSEILIEKMGKKFPKWCPIEQMAQIAQDETQPIEIRAKCADRVAAYMYSKPKEEKSVPPSEKDMATLIREARIRVGILQSGFAKNLQNSELKLVGEKTSI